MKKILILSSFPAPYRVDVFEELTKDFCADVFFERSGDKQRNDKWIVKKDFYKLLDTAAGLSEYKSNTEKENIKKYSLVIIYEYSTKIAMKLMSECIRCSVPYAINCDGAFITNNFLKDIVKKHYIKNASLYFATGKNARNYFLHYGADENKIFYHNFSTLHSQDILDQIPAESDKRIYKEQLGIKQRPTVIAVGRLAPVKGFDILLRTWGDMDDKANLLIIGEGSEKENYESIIKTKNYKNVSLCGFLPFEDTLSYFLASDIFVLPTLYDPWGLVVNEAMSKGLPVITTDRCVAGNEIVKNGENGYVISAKSETELYEKINYLIDNPILCKKMGENNLKKIRPYTIENIAESHKKTINSFIDGK